jgi:hypothetical protein
VYDRGRPFQGWHILVNERRRVVGHGARHHLDGDSGFSRGHGDRNQAVMAGTRDAARRMSKRGGGSNINRRSIGGIKPAAA